MECFDVGGFKFLHNIMIGKACTCASLKKKCKLLDRRYDAFFLGMKNWDKSIFLTDPTCVHQV